jgi:outer membrane protein assembly factor BamD
MSPPRHSVTARPGALLVAALCLGAGLGASGCASSGQVRANRTITDEAEARYEAAMVRLRDEEWPEAQEAFRAVRTEYSGSRWGWLAELRLADIEFRQERFTEALTQYRSWIRYHPTQREAVYAHFMIAKCYVAQMPEDWLLVPPSWERDMSAVHDAESALARFVREYPESDNLAEAQRLLGQVRQLLARHEMYVAEFYANRERWEASIGRYRGAIATFDNPDIRARALLQLGEVYLRTRRFAEARGAFGFLVTEYPARAEAASARLHLTRLGDGDTVELDLSDAVIRTTPRPARSTSGDPARSSGSRPGRR